MTSGITTTRTLTAMALLAIALAPTPGWTQSGVDEEIIVTGSRIRQSPLDEAGPVTTLTAEDLKRSGLTSISDVVSRLTSSGGALNTRFNSSGNFGFPPDGSGVGAGSAQVDLRHLGSKRVLVLVDGVRWISESSASGVGSSTDLNTIPVSIIERVEILEDGASAIYGADAIAGVVNIITKRDFEGFEINGYLGDYSEGDGSTTEFSMSLGAANDETAAFVNVSHVQQDRIAAFDIAQARESAGPGTTNRHGSSGTPQGRFVLTIPEADGSITDDSVFVNCTLNDGVSTAAGAPAFFDINNPCAGDDFNTWDNGDRFNFAPFNLVVTPSERTSIYGQATHAFTPNVNLYIKGLFNNRKSTNQAAPEPLFIGSDAGNGNILDTISIDVTNPFNPFGATISAEDQAYFMGRRPLEGGPRQFEQDVDTWYAAAGLEGEFDMGERTFFWDVNTAWSRNNANQIKTGGYNARRLKDALGPAFLDDDGVYRCGTADNPIDGCVPFNFFGGQGANGEGTITQAMLDWVAFQQQDTSEQELVTFTANISSTLVDLPAGPLAFAVGLEHREQDGFFQPDAIVVAGDSAGIPAQPTSGGFDVDEIYGEINIPLLTDVPGADLLDLSIAARSSDYSTFGSETTTKFGVRWRPTDTVLLRGAFAEGLRAPTIGELFGSQTRFDATIADPCSDLGSPDSPASQTVIDNCVANGVPVDGSYTQLGGQISVLTGGNRALQPETADTLNFGVVFSPSFVDNLSWVDGLDVEVSWYQHEVADAIQAIDAQTVLDACANTGEASFCNLVGRTGSGVINRFDNQLINIGGIETQGWDLNVSYISPVTDAGQFSVSWQNTFLSDFTEILADPSSPGGFRERSLEGLEENDRGKPEWKSNLIVDWLRGDWSGSWTVRYIDELTEDCGDFLDNSPDSFTNLGLCSQPDFDDNANSKNTLDSTVFNDVQLTYTPEALGGNFDITLGINNVFEEDPPDCYSCSLNGYDPSTYDVPGRFTYLRASWRPE